MASFGEHLASFREHWAPERGGSSVQIQIEVGVLESHPLYLPRHARRVQQLGDHESKTNPSKAKETKRKQKGLIQKQKKTKRKQTVLIRKQRKTERKQKGYPGEAKTVRRPFWHRQQQSEVCQQNSSREISLYTTEQYSTV